VLGASTGKEALGMTLEEEGERATSMLLGKTVRRVMRHRDGEVVIEFEDGSRLFADSGTPLELSVTLGHTSI
jgi:hypothetical protein